ncbi:MAG: SPOR domain-containing protein [Trueperaceae bacterium]
MSSSRHGSTGSRAGPGVRATGNVTRAPRNGTRAGSRRAASSLRVVALLFVLVAGRAAAQGPAVLHDPALQQDWTVQTVALRDFREANEVVKQLRALGLDAYTEFAMNDGHQFVRVRIGCYASRSGAEAMAAALRGRVTAEATAVELSAGAPVAGCVRVDVGFRKPYEWAEVEVDGVVPAFRVVVAGIPARIVHDGTRWAVLQGDGSVPTVDAALPRGAFETTPLGGVPMVRMGFGATALVLCPGTLIGQVGQVAIVELGSVVMACSLEVGGARAMGEVGP